MCNAERASSVSMQSDNAQPTTRREYRSRRTAKSNQPSLVEMYVMSPASTWFGAGAFEVTLEQIRGDPPRVSRVRRLSKATWRTAAEPVSAHQSSHLLLARSGSAPSERTAPERAHSY
jgi:hypothetical protein